MTKIIEGPKERCERCNCLFSYDKEDIEYRLLEVDGVFYHVWYVVCPSCGKYITVDCRLSR